MNTEIRKFNSGKTKDVKEVNTSCICMADDWFEYLPRLLDLTVN